MRCVGLQSGGSGEVQIRAEVDYSSCILYIESTGTPSTLHSLLAYSSLYHNTLTNRGNAKGAAAERV